MTLLLNGLFAGNLAYWTGTGGINRTLGYPRLGCVQLDAGESIEQQVGVSADALYTLHYFYRLATGATLTAGYGSVTQQHTGTPLDAWREGVLVFALDASENDSVAFNSSGAACYVDTVTLLSWALPVTRLQLATMIAASLRGLATDAALSSTATGDKPEGDYSQAIDEALRSLGAVGLFGDPDVTRLTARQINDAVEAGRSSMLQFLRSDYALRTDVTLGPRSESLSQIASSIDEMIAGASSDRRVKIGRLIHADWLR